MPRKMDPLTYCCDCEGRRPDNRSNATWSGGIFCAARGTGQKPRRLRRSASAREDLRTAIKTSPGLEVPELDLTLDLTLDRRTLPRVVIAARDVLVRIEVAARDVIIVEPYIVFHIALGAPINSSTEGAHPRIDRRRPVLAHVSDDGRLAGAKNKRGLAGRLIARVRAIQVRRNANHT